MYICMSTWSTLKGDQHLDARDREGSRRRMRAMHMRGMHSEAFAFAWVEVWDKGKWDGNWKGQRKL